MGVFNPLGLVRPFIRMTHLDDIVKDGPISVCEAKDSEGCSAAEAITTLLRNPVVREADPGGAEGVPCRPGSGRKVMGRMCRIESWGGVRVAGSGGHGNAK